MTPRRNAPAARNVVGYVRISRDRSNETSTTTQEAAIAAYCLSRGWTLVKVVTEPGRSAFKASRKSRPGFREAMQVIAAGAADAFVVWKIDRACRNTLDLLTLVEDLEGHGAEFASVTEQFDTSTPIGQAMLTIVGALAQLESAQKSERATEWHTHRRLTAAVPAGKPAIGYLKPKPNRLVIDPKVAPLVRDAAEQIADGASVLSVVKDLNGAGVQITHRGLTTALRSPTLAGLVAVSEGVLPRQGGARILDAAELVPGDWEPILDRDLWDRVRRQLDTPGRRTSPGNGLRWPLVPIARCWCGSAMRHHVEKWRTNGGEHTMGRLLCMDQSCLTGIGYDAVEEAVTAAVLDLLDDATWGAIRTRSTGEAVDSTAVAERLERLWQMVLDGTVEPEEYAEAKARWMGELVAATAEPADLPDVDDVRAAWPRLSAQERHLVFRTAIASLVIRPATRRGGRGVDLTRVDLALA